MSWEWELKADPSSNDDSNPQCEHDIDPRYWKETGEETVDNTAADLWKDDIPHLKENKIQNSQEDQE